MAVLRTPVYNGCLGAMNIDLHAHTFPSSDDCAMSPDELVEAAKGAGLDGVCVTEHDRFWDPADIRALSKRHGFLVLPGCEVNTDGGHVLAFGLDRYVFGIHRVESLRRLVDLAQGVMVAAHPHRRRFLHERGASPDGPGPMVDRACADPFFAYCDALEVINGKAAEGENAFSLELARRLGKPMTGGSDSHRQSQMGAVATMFHDRITCLDDLIREIKTGRCEAVALEAGGVERTPASNMLRPGEGG